MPLSRHKVLLEDHDPSWAGEFELEKKILLEKLGLESDRILHVGSTAIKGILAKPVIDILVGIDSLGETNGWKAKLEGAGYAMRSNACTEDRKFFAKGSEYARTHYVHLVEFGGEQWRQLVSFRDYMNANPDKAQEYAALKRDLARKHPDDRKSYRVGKEEFISNILKLIR